ncbi:MAG: 50S ribosomal protein L30e [Candidatus Hydrothermarchaeaceae archaeon]
MSIEKKIRTATDTGKAVFGERQTLKFVRNKGVKLVIVASNCPEEKKKSLYSNAEAAGIKVYEYPGSSVELGSACGKPFIISMLGIIEPGNSDVLELSRR